MGRTFSELLGPGTLRHIHERRSGCWTVGVAVRVVRGPPNGRPGESESGRRIRGRTRPAPRTCRRPDPGIEPHPRPPLVDRDRRARVQRPEVDEVRARSPRGALNWVFCFDWRRIRRSGPSVGRDLERRRGRPGQRSAGWGLTSRVERCGADAPPMRLYVPCCVLSRPMCAGGWFAVCRPRCSTIAVESLHRRGADRAERPCRPGPDDVGGRSGAEPAPRAVVLTGDGIADGCRFASRELDVETVDL